MDQATSLLRQSQFDRTTVHMFCRVLEDAWLLVGPRSKASLPEKDGRLNVADGILGSAKAGRLDPNAMKHYAVTRALSLLVPERHRRARASNGAL